MVYHSRRGSHGVKQVSISALVDQRAEPTILHFQEFTGLVKFNLFLKIYYFGLRGVR